MKLSHRDNTIVVKQPISKKCFHPYTTLHRNIDCKYYIDGQCTYIEKEGCGYIYEELKKGEQK